MSVTFEVFEDARNNWRWRLRHTNGNVISVSGEGYSSRSEAKNAIERVQKYAPESHVLDANPAMFEVYKDSEEQWRWRLRHRNGNIIADSGEGYSSRTAAQDAIESVKVNAPDAPDEETDD